MKIVMDLMLWLAPFFLVSGGFCLSRFKKMRFQRYVFYAVILCVAFLIDLNSLKFSNHWLNVTWFLSLTLIFSEIFWSVNRFKNRLFYLISLVMGILIFSYTFRQWLIRGPGQVSSLWESKVVSEHSRGDDRYRIREEIKDQKTHDKTFKLYKCLRFMPMEKYKDKFKIPDGYDRAQFRFRWHVRNGAVMVDIIGDYDVLWTLLGETVE